MLIMLIKFFSRGQGNGRGPVEYACRADLEGRELVQPEVLQGDAECTTELIDSIDRDWRYTSGVISFALEDAPTPEQQKQVMDEFETLAFAGLEADQYDILWVRHQHTQGGRVELHFVTPRMELTTGKALNIAPPGWEKTYGPLVRALNAENGWARPEDPERARELQKGPQRAAEKLSSKEAIHAYVCAQIDCGAIYDRSSLVLGLVDAGLQVNRQGKDYVTALDPETGDKFRMKGTIYEQSWTREQHIERALVSEARRGQETDRGIDAERAQEARAELSRRIERRIQHHRERYPRAAPDHGEELARDTALAALGRFRLHGDCSDSLGFALGGDVVAAQRPDRSESRDAAGEASPFGYTKPDWWNPDREERERRVSGVAERRGIGLDVHRSEAAVHTASVGRLVENGETQSFGARIAFFRARFAGWYRGGNRRLEAFLGRLRDEREERYRAALVRDGARAEQSQSAFAAAGRSEHSLTGKISDSYGKLRDALERLRGGHEHIERHTEQAREVIRQQEREKAHKQSSHRQGRGWGERGM